MPARSRITDRKVVSFKNKEMNGKKSKTYRVGIAPVSKLLQPLDKLSIDAQRTSNDRHDVLRQCTRLVRANDRRVGHGFTRAEDSDEKVHLRHSLRCEGEGEGDGEGKTFGNGDDDLVERHNENKVCQTTVDKERGEREERERRTTVTAMMRISTKAAPFCEADRAGTPVPSWTKNRIMSEPNKIAPATEPRMAMSSARALSLSWSGVGGASPRRAAESSHTEMTGVRLRIQKQKGK